MLNRLKTALDSTGYPFRHVAWAKAPSGTYGTYMEDGADHLYADDGVYQQFLEGTVDIYTTDDSGTPIITVQQALTLAKISWRYELGEFDADTGYIHYQWGFEVVGDGSAV